MKTIIKFIAALGITFALCQTATAATRHDPNVLSGFPTAIAAATTTNFSSGASGQVQLWPDSATYIKVAFQGTGASSTNSVTLKFIGLIDKNAADSTGITKVTIVATGLGTNWAYADTNVSLGALPYLRLDEVVTGAATGITNLSVTVVTKY